VGIKFNPVTGRLDVVYDSYDFSFENITETLTIPENQQMIVCDELTLDSEIIIKGTLVIRA